MRAIVSKPIAAAVDWSTRYGYVFAVLAVGVATAAFMPGRSALGTSQWALLYLLVIVAVAGVAGGGPGLLAGLLSFLAWNFFFLPPVHTFIVREAQDWIALAAFLGVAAITAFITGSLRQRELRAVRRERETSFLSRVSVELVSQTSTGAMARTVLEDARQLVDARATFLYLNDSSGHPAITCAVPPAVSSGGHNALRIVEWVARNRMAIGLPHDWQKVAPPGNYPESMDPERLAVGIVAYGEIYLPLLTPSGCRGVLRIGPPQKGGPYGPRAANLLVSLANLIASFLERQAWQQAALQADRLREADQLKASLLSSVSHQLKTPLAGLTATISNLLEGDVAWDEVSVHQELRAALLDIARLSRSIGALLDLSRLESHTWEPRWDWHDVEDIVASATMSLPIGDRERVTADVPADLPPVFVDYEQVVRVLQSLLENAAVYAGPAAHIRAFVRTEPGVLRLCVEDDGPGIPEEERELVFEKFYRTQKGARVPSGTGLGLAISREIVVAHGGTIRAEGLPPHGLRMVVDLPQPIIEPEAVGCGTAHALPEMAAGPRW